MSIFAERIKQLRTEKKLTQREVAEILKITPGHYLKIENDKVEPTITILKLLADYYKVTTDYLLGRMDGQRFLTDESLELLFEEFMKNFLQEAEQMRSKIFNFAEGMPKEMKHLLNEGLDKIREQNDLQI